MVDIVRVKYWKDIPDDFTGIAEREKDGARYYYKNGKKDKSIMYTLTESEDGTWRCYEKGTLHCDHGAAVFRRGDETADQYWLNGKRTTKEAVEALKKKKND